MGMGMGVNLCPWVLKGVGIESFYGYGFGQKKVVGVERHLWDHKNPYYGCRGAGLQEEQD